MGREIRRVPPNWEHPKNDKGYIPLYDEDIETAGRRWVDNCIAWDNGTHEDLLKDPERKKDFPFFWMWDGGPPDAETHRAKFYQEPTWVQMYETVSEGTPVTPPFSTKEELVDYLVEYGTFWDREDGKGGWERKNAEQFVRDEYAPSMYIVPGKGIFTPRDGYPE